MSFIEILHRENDNLYFRYSVAYPREHGLSDGDSVCEVFL